MKKLAVLMLIVGLGLITFWTMTQQYGDEIVSEVRKATNSTVVQVPDPAPDAPLKATIEVRKYVLKISNKGGLKQLNACAGGFTQMTQYNGMNGRDIYSAHNNCGGDVILPIQLGDRVVLGDKGEFTVTDLRDTSKHIRTDAINNMNGTVLVQTCYYKDNKMKFIGLTPVGQEGKVKELLGENTSTDSNIGNSEVVSQ